MTPHDSSSVRFAATLSHEARETLKSGTFHKFDLLRKTMTWALISRAAGGVNTEPITDASEASEASIRELSDI